MKTTQKLLQTLVYVLIIIGLFILPKDARIEFLLFSAVTLLWVIAVSVSKPLK